MTTITRPIGVHAGAACAVLTLLLLSSLPHAAPAGDVAIEAETYFDSWDIAAPSIQPVECESASDHWAVDGVDTQGEWIALHLTLPERLCFFSKLGSAANPPYVRTWEIQYHKDDLSEPIIAADTLTTEPGQGL